MKRIYILLLLAAAALLGYSCDRTDPYIGGDDPDNYGAFVTLSQASFTVTENAGSFTVPIRVLNNKGTAFKVTVSTTDGTAVNGTHYSIVEPATGVIEFEPADSVKTISFGLTHIPGYAEPGKVEFSFYLSSATGGVEIGALRKGTVTINDADHPLSDLIGAWTVHGYDASDGTSYRETTYTMNLSAYQGDVTKLYCDAINEMPIQMKGYGFEFPPVYCDVSEDKSTLSFPTGQPGADMGSSNGGVLELTSGYIDNGYYVKDLSAIVFTRQEDGTYRCNDGILWLNDYVWPTYGGYFLGSENGVYTTWTKQ